MIRTATPAARDAIAAAIPHRVVEDQPSAAFAVCASIANAGAAKLRRHPQRVLAIAAAYVDDPTADTELTSLSGADCRAILDDVLAEHGLRLTLGDLQVLADRLRAERPAWLLTPAEIATIGSAP